MTPLRLFLGLLFAALAVYTAPVALAYGVNILPLFFGEIFAMTWQGQFNFDFFVRLLLSGFWTAWRNEFSPAGLALAVLAVFGGISFLAAYLLILAIRLDDDAAVIILGPRRAAALRSGA